MKRVTLRDGREVCIRQLRPEDKDGLVAFGRGLSARSGYLFAPHDWAEATIGGIVEAHQRGHRLIYVAESDGDLVAYFFFERPETPIPTLGLGVTDAYQDVGLGHVAMETLIAVARGRGAEGVSLTTEQHNDRAFALYSKFGFEHVGDDHIPLAEGGERIERRMFLALRAGAERPPAQRGRVDSREGRA